MAAGNFACYVSVTINVDTGVIQVKPRKLTDYVLMDVRRNSLPAALNEPKRLGRL